MAIRGTPLGEKMLELLRTHFGIEGVPLSSALGLSIADMQKLGFIEVDDGPLTGEELLAQLGELDAKLAAIEAYAKALKL